ncbi:MAG: hypothetical protein HQL58_03010 [Magnetococcales bacterium]|nr:hypothetical protein [Magnetococcales bacterium]
MAIQSIAILAALLKRGMIFIRQHLSVRRPNPQIMTDPMALQIGDHIHFGQLLQPPLQNGHFQVVAIDTVVLDNVRQSVLMLVGEDGSSCYLTMSDSDHAETILLRIGRHVSDKTIGQLFNIDELTALFEEEPNETTSLALKRRRDLPLFSGWTASSYYPALHAINGIRHRGDFRNSAFMPLPIEGEGFDYYLMLSQNQRHGVAIEVNDEGRIALSLMIQLAPEAIERIERFSATRKSPIRSFAPY